MKRIISFGKAIASEIKNALTPEQKTAICEDAKEVIAMTMNGEWAKLATHIVSDIEATIK